MLDKSVPHYHIFMRRRAGQSIPKVELPEGYSISLFREGDEADWARIETSVLEFDSEREALDCYREWYLPYRREIERRCLFAVAPDGGKVGTTTLWWEYTGVRRDPWLHWVAVCPDHQGKRLGKALVARALELMTEMEGDRDSYLHTQTWSHKAVGVYESLGFAVTAEQGLNGKDNTHWREALEVLERIREGAPDV